MPRRTPRATTLLAPLFAALLAGAPAARADSPLPEIVAAGAEAPGAPFTTLDLDWRDTARQRAVPARLYLPEGADAAHPAPLVVFSHGIGGSRLGYSYLGRFWASRGIASLHVQHVGSDRGLWAGNPFTLVARLHAAAQEQEAVARTHDVRFALDTLLAGPLAERIDAARIVAAGHSYGANTTLLLAGAQVERQGRRIDLHDPRIKAAIVISAPPFHGEPDPAAILARVTVPTLHVTATDDVIAIPGYQSGAADRIALFEAVGGAHKALAVFSGGSHGIFTDRSTTGGAVLNPQVKAATRQLSLAFLQQVFDGQDGALQQWPARHAALLARYTRTGF